VLSGGRCKKCVGTAVPLRVLGVWDDALLFSDKGNALNRKRIERAQFVLPSRQNSR
jgi:hypothetical protein